jgi:hypothetical protein
MRGMYSVNIMEGGIVGVQRRRGQDTYCMYCVNMTGKSTTGRTGGGEGGRTRPPVGEGGGGTTTGGGGRTTTGGGGGDTTGGT